MYARYEYQNTARCTPSEKTNSYRPILANGRLTPKLWVTVTVTDQARHLPTERPAAGVVLSPCRIARSLTDVRRPRAAKRHAR